MNKKIHMLLCISFIIGACTVTAPQPTPTSVPTPLPSPPPEWERAGWVIAWHDEFDSTELDLKNWTFDLGGGGWGNMDESKRVSSSPMDKGFGPPSGCLERILLRRAGQQQAKLILWNLSEKHQTRSMPQFMRLVIRAVMVLDQASSHLQIRSGTISIC